MENFSITMLNSMANQDFEKSLDQHVKWGLHHLDVKDSVFGKGVSDLTDAEATKAAAMISQRGLSVYCMSTQLFHDDIEIGEPAFRKAHLSKLERVIAVAKILRPDLVRLLSARTLKRKTIRNSLDYIRGEHPWLIRSYQEAIERLSAAGLGVTIENECHDNILSSPTEIINFFDEINLGDAVNLTWDVANLWQMGTFPTMEVYQRLQPLIAYFHLKGGQLDSDPTALRWKSSLQDASWPVKEITRQVVLDGCSHVICLNGSHGEKKQGYNYDNVTIRDLEFVRKILKEI